MRNIINILLLLFLTTTLFSKDISVKLDSNSSSECFAIVNANGDTLFYIQADGTIGEQGNATIVGSMKYANGNHGNNEILTSDNVGNASWKSTKDNMQPSLVLNFGFEPGGIAIRMFGFNFSPRGLYSCDGSIGSPDLRGRVPVHAGTGSGLTNRVLGQLGGTETFTQ